MFDLTKEITLDKKNSALYQRIQAAFYLIAILAAFYLGYLIIFPTQYFSFSFPNPNSTQNTVVNPRNTQGQFLDHGNFDAADAMIFDTALSGNYGRADISFTLDKKSDPLESAQVEARKSYQAFLYPEGDNFGWKNGTLLKNQNNFYIVSNGNLRKFSNENMISTLGYSKNAFVESSDEELKYNSQGEMITDAKNYPDDTIFRIKDDYYILTDQKLKKFISPQAYLTQYNDSQAILKDESFLQNYPPEEDLIGFRDGTLVSYGISVFIISSGHLLPVNNVTTFTAMGYDWNDVIPASGDEISLYEKEKLFTLSGAHPEGTVFLADDENKFYIISGGKKHLLPSGNIAKSWLPKSKPVAASGKSLEISDSCQLSQTYSGFNLRTYSCQMPLDNFLALAGKDYEFKLTGDQDIKIENINVAFKKTATWDNLKSQARDMLTRIRSNYGYAPAQ